MKVEIQRPGPPHILSKVQTVDNTWGQLQDPGVLGRRSMEALASHLSPDNLHWIRPAVLCSSTSANTASPIALSPSPMHPAAGVAVAGMGSRTRPSGLAALTPTGPEMQASRVPGSTCFFFGLCNVGPGRREVAVKADDVTAGKLKPSPGALFYLRPACTSSSSKAD